MNCRCHFLQVIVSDLVDAPDSSRQDARWEAVLEHGPATWPEVLRRYVLTRLAPPEVGLAIPSVISAASALSEAPFDSLEPPQKLSLLSLLADELLDTDAIRGQLQQRLDARRKLVLG